MCRGATPVAEKWNAKLRPWGPMGVAHSDQLPSRPVEAKPLLQAIFVLTNDEVNPVIRALRGERPSM